MASDAVWDSGDLRLALRPRADPAPTVRAIPLARPGAAIPGLAVDREVRALAAIVRLYWLVLGTVPDRPGLRHHAGLLACGQSLDDMALSMLTRQTAPEPTRQQALLLWRRDGRRRSGFEAAWRQVGAPEAGRVARFAARLAADPTVSIAPLLPLLFDDGIDPAADDVARAWGYRLWSLRNDQVLALRVRRRRALLRVAGAVIVLRMRVDAGTDPAMLTATLASLAGQSYGRWRLAFDGSLPGGFALPTDPRLDAGPVAGWRRRLHGGIAAGDVLSADCLAVFALAALRQPDATGWVCDHDRIDGEGARFAPVLDPVSSDGLRLGREPGGTGVMRHLPAVLLHRSGPVRHRAVPVPIARDGVAVSVVIATRDQPVLLTRCIDSLRRITAGPLPEIVLVDNGSTDPQALLLLDRLAAEGCVLLRRPGAFNWSALNNAGVRAASGRVLVLLNNDVECIEPEWLGRLVDSALDPTVGPVGATLLYPQGGVQHAGIVIGPGAQAAHRWSDGVDDDVHAVAAVTGACMAFRRGVFERLGGLDEALPVTWNDIDFCLRAREAGLAVRLCVPAVLRHRERGTRLPDEAPVNQAQLARTRAYVATRHAGALARDRFAHPLSVRSSGGRLLDTAASQRIWSLLFPIRRALAVD